MHLTFDEQGYVCCVLYGCHTSGCIEYTGLVPTQPEEYADIDDWADRARVQAYYLNDQGNLIYDAERAAAIPDEDYIPPYSAEMCETLGIAQREHTHTQKDIEDLSLSFDNLTDCNLSAGCLKIGKAAIRAGATSDVSVGSSAADVTINFTDGDFSGFTTMPILTVTPYCTANAGVGYGIFAYIKAMDKTGATVRVTSNYTSSTLTVSLRWMAIGTTD